MHDVVFSSDQKAKEEVDGIDTENLAVLERLKQSQRDEYLKVLCTWTVDSIKNGNIFVCSELILMNFLNSS